MTARSATPHTQSPDVTAFTAWLTASCERQGVPVTIHDPGVITQVATLLGPAYSTGSGRVRIPESARKGRRHVSSRRFDHVGGTDDTSGLNDAVHDPHTTPRAA